MCGHGEREREGETYAKSNMETYIAMCKIDSQREFAVWLWNSNMGSASTWRGGMRREMGGRFQKEGIYVYLRLIQVEVWQTTTKFCKAITLVVQSCLTLCDPMNHSTPGLTFHHQLPEFTQTHVHQVGDAIQSSHSLSSPSPLASVFPSIRVFSNESVLHQVAKVLKLQHQHQSFWRIFRTDFC